MKFVQNIFDKTRPLVEKDGKRNILYPLHNALETMAFVPDHTRTQVHTFVMQLI